MKTKELNNSDILIYKYYCDAHSSFIISPIQIGHFVYVFK